MKRAKYPTRKIYMVGEPQKQMAITLLQNAPIDSEKPLEVRIGEKVEKRNLDQNALMWSFINDISHQGYIDGSTFSPDAWHYHFKLEFLPEEADPELTREDYKKYEYAPNGDRILVGSTTDLTVKGFSLKSRFIETRKVCAALYEMPCG